MNEKHSDLDSRIRFQISDLDSRFRFQIQISDFRFRFQIQISESDFRFRFQIQISDSDFRFRFKMIVVQLGALRPETPSIVVQLGAAWRYEFVSIVVSRKFSGKNARTDLYKKKNTRGPKEKNQKTRTNRFIYNFRLKLKVQ